MAHVLRTIWFAWFGCGGYCTRDYPPEHHLPTLEAMLSLDLKNLQSKRSG